MTDHAIVALIEREFGGVLRPEHFTDFRHCCECAEHDEMLRSRDRDALSIADVGNPGWDPLCFCTAEGLAYYVPALARLALAEPEYEQGWYGEQLLFHLSWEGTENRLLQYCSRTQRAAVASLLAHIIDRRAALIESYRATDEFLKCYELWRGEREPGAAV